MQQHSLQTKQLVRLLSRSFSSFSSIPIIDVAPLVSSASSLVRKKVGQQLHAACRDVGFFSIVNHGVPEEIYRGVLAEARRWFSLPASVKNQIALSSKTHYRGYQPLGANVTRYLAGNGEGAGFSRDWHEGIDLYKECPPNPSESPIYGFNPLLNQHPPFPLAMYAYISQCLNLGRALMRGIALGLQLPEDTFETNNTAEDPYWVTRVIQYPPLTSADNYDPSKASQAAQKEHISRDTQLSCGEHTDYGLLTIVNQDSDITALQVQNTAKQWIDVPPIEGAFVCNIGDMLKVWTNGMYVPTLHRVVNRDPERSRVSIPFFYEPNYRANVAPLSEIVERMGGEVKERAVVYGKHLESKVLSNFEL